MIKTLSINIARIILSLTFILSGFVKAIDPIGTQYKIQDYLEAVDIVGFVPDWITLGASVLLSMLEFSLGMFLLFAISRRVVSKMILAFMVVMTCITVWIYFADPVSDCGCFGDAIKLTNGETLLKNIVLLALAVAVAWQPLKMPRFVSLTNQWMVLHYTLLFSLGISIWSLYDLPIFDFRPYYIGANIREGMEIPEDEEPPKYETTFILEKDGVRKTFGIDNYPDSTWTFIDSETKMVSEGYIPPIHDFSIDMDGEDLTDSILNAGYVFLLIAPHLENASEANFGNIDMVYEYAHDNNYPFYCLTASGEKAIERWKDMTGAEYPFCSTDEITLKTVIRSNPGLVLLKNGTIIGKWSHNSLPADELMTTSLEKSKIGTLQENGVYKRLFYIMLWFVLPLMLLTIADRLWMWSHWLRKKEEEKFTKYKPLLKTEKDNEKENCSR